MAPFFTGFTRGIGGGGFGKRAGGAAVSFSATGGTITPSSGFTIHTFTTPGSFTVSSGTADIEYLVVGGAGGGAFGYGSGAGGGGGVRESVSYSIVPGTYPVTVGPGGQGGPSHTNGSDSVFGSITARGGGKGEQYGFPTPVATAGGSGGGGGGAPNGINSGGAGNTPTTIGEYIQGQRGGDGEISPLYGGGGGGGVASVGLPGNGNGSGGSGGRGLVSTISGSSVTYASGGTGGSYSGGAGAPGAANRGIGGGGGGNGNPGGPGGSGVVIIRYATTQTASSFVSASGGTTIDIGNYRTHVFTSTGPGSFVVNSLSNNPAYNTAMVIVIGGGGSAGDCGAGGGGAGGVLIDRHFPLAARTYPLSVGSAAPQRSGCGNGSPGSDSTFADPGGPTTYTAYGGGGGGGADGGSGQPGGSGGGGSYNASGGNATQTSQGTFTGYGSPGGRSSAPQASGGGGGAGDRGQNAPVYPGGLGEVGIYLEEFSSPSFPCGGSGAGAGYYAAGGAGYQNTPSGRQPNGAVGPGSSTRNNSGDGSFQNQSPGAGSGVIMVRYRYQ